MPHLHKLYLFLSLLALSEPLLNPNQVRGCIYHMNTQNLNRLTLHLQIRSLLIRSQ